MMNTHDHSHGSLQGPDSLPAPDMKRSSSSLGRPLKRALLMVTLVGGFYLLREHWDHVAGNWIYLLLLACPLMHLLHGHGGQGRHGRYGGQSAGPRNEGDKG
jgi:hypothetical protein